jgi:CheY-like chemotaxis protein
MPKSLLVADDSLTIRKVIGMILATEDFQITSVDNGLEAINKARELRPDLVLADVTMPGRSGYEVCEAIKNDPGMQAVRVLLLAGTFEPFDENRSRAVKADDYIVKPFESNAFLEKVRALTGAPRQAEVPRQVFVPEFAASGTKPVAPVPPPAAPPGRASGPIPATSASFPGSGGPPRPSAPAYSLGHHAPAVAHTSAPPPGIRPSAPMPVAQPVFARPPTPARVPIPGNPAMLQYRPSAVARPSQTVPPSAGGPTGPAGAFRPIPGVPQPARASPAPGPVVRPPQAPIGQRMGGQPAYGLPTGSPEPQRRDLPATARLPQVARADGGEALLREALAKASREVIERIVWEVVPQLAENIIREHLDQLLKNREARS